MAAWLTGGTICRITDLIETWQALTRFEKSLQDDIIA
jgi:hypothetical protein